MKMRLIIAVFFVAFAADQYHKSIVPMSYINPVDVSFYSTLSFCASRERIAGMENTCLVVRADPSFRAPQFRTLFIKRSPAYEQKAPSTIHSPQ